MKTLRPDVNYILAFRKSLQRRIANGQQMRTAYLRSCENAEGKRDAEDAERFQERSRTHDGPEASEHYLPAWRNTERRADVYALRVHDSGRSA